MAGNSDRIAMCTTSYFDGVIAVIDPENSWVARWQRGCTLSFPFHCSWTFTHVLNSQICARNVCSAREREDTGGCRDWAWEAEYQVSTEGPNGSGLKFEGAVWSSWQSTRLIYAMAVYITRSSRWLVVGFLTRYLTNTSTKLLPRSSVLWVGTEMGLYSNGRAFYPSEFKIHFQ